MKHWSHFFNESNTFENLTFPMEFLFVFALLEFTKKYKVEIKNIKILSITFSKESRMLENGERYRENMRSVWVASDLKALSVNELESISEDSCFFEMSKRFYKARDKTKKRILQIELLVGESVVEVFQDLSIKFLVNNQEVREWYSIPVGFCLYKQRINDGKF